MSASATMTSTIQRPSRPPLAPPCGPLPALPITKTRRPLADIPDAPESRPGSAGSLLPTPVSKLPARSVTVSGLPSPRKSQSTPAVPTLNTSLAAVSSISPASPPSGLPAPGQGLRKPSSIGAFPLPPKGNPRVASLPPSPLSTSESATDASCAKTPNNGRRDTTTHQSAESGARKPRARSSGYGLRARISASAASGVSGSPSLLNGSGENSFISSAEGARGSDGLLSLPSPPQSRSSSAHGSYVTDGTTFEDVDGEDIECGRPKSQDAPTDSRRVSGAKETTKGNVLVSVRVRPEVGGADVSNNDGEWMVDGRRSLVSYKGKEGGDYHYDNVFSPHDHNARVYDNLARRLVRRVMEGYHGTVFAYGMTGTGKTFSMQGTANSPGVIPLAINDIFSYIRENPNREFLLRVSYLEIYNEKLYDLLSQNKPGQPQQEEIKLREDAKRGVYATPLKEEIVQSPNQLLRVIARGDLARRTSSTQFNARSSRSHAVVQIVVESRERTPSHGAYFEREKRKADRILPGGVLVSTLSLIDLAGSERAAESKERRTEGAHINKSLLTLGTVIGRLTNEDDKEDGANIGEKEKGLKHLPYRDSKLTRLLQPALSGNSLVSILCTIQLSSAGTSAALATSHTGETLNTLKFASRAKNNIVSHAKRNESNTNPGDSGSRALLDRYRIEIQELRAQLDAQNKAKEEAEKWEEIEEDRKVEEELERQERTRHEEQMLEMQLARTALKERISHLNRLILSSKSLGVNAGRYSSASMPINRMSVSSNNEFGGAVSVRGRDSIQSSGHRDSSPILEVPHPEEAGLNRTLSLSAGSISMGVLPAAQVSQLVSGDDEALEEEGEDSAGADGEGNASILQQNQMLQSDLADKNRYIATLEKRLIQARRTSHSRVSMYSNRPGVLEEGTLEQAVREKDREIQELRARLDDQIRTVTALRSAARKRDMTDKRKSQQSDGTVRPATSTGVRDGPLPSLAQTVGSRAPSRSARFANGSGHRSNPSTASSRSNGIVNLSKIPLSPVALLSPSISEKSDSVKECDSRYIKTPRRQSVDEMTMLLDQMIQDKVESGQIRVGERGSLRIKRDTVMERGADIGAEVHVEVLEEE